MSNLSAFLAGNAVSEENVKYPASKRFVDGNGEPMMWELQAIETEEDEDIRNKFTKSVLVPGTKNQYMQKFDANGYLAVVAARCTVFPNLNDSELQDSYKVMGADKLLKKMLNKPGEYQDYLKKVQEVNGFIPLSDMVEEAKN